MWPDLVVVVTRERQLAPGLIQAVEYLLVQELVPLAAVEAFDKGVFLRLTRIYVVPWHGVLTGPFQDGLTGELRPIVTDNATRLAS